jgi:hypothetical protein
MSEGSKRGPLSSDKKLSNATIAMSPNAPYGGYFAGENDALRHYNGVF